MIAHCWLSVGCHPLSWNNQLNNKLINQCLYQHCRGIFWELLSSHAVGSWYFDLGQPWLIHSTLTHYIRILGWSSKQVFHPCSKKHLTAHLRQSFRMGWFSLMLREQHVIWCDGDGLLIFLMTLWCHLHVVHMVGRTLYTIIYLSMTIVQPTISTVSP